MHITPQPKLSRIRVGRTLLSAAFAFEVGVNLDFEADCDPITKNHPGSGQECPLFTTNESTAARPSSIIVVRHIWPLEPRLLPELPAYWTHPTESASACSTHSAVGDIWRPTSILSAFS